MKNKIKLSIVILLIFSGCRSTNKSESDILTSNTEVNEESRVIEDKESSTIEDNENENRGFTIIEIEDIEETYQEKVYEPKNFFQKKLFKELESIEFKPYENIEYVKVEDFEFGDYLPMLAFEEDRFLVETSIFNYALLSNDCSSLTDGELLYQPINSKINGIDDYSRNYEIMQKLGDFYKYIGNKRVIKISDDCEEIICSQIIYKKILDGEPVFDVIIYIYIEGKNILERKIIEDGKLYDVIIKTEVFLNKFENLWPSIYQDIKIELPNQVYITQVINNEWILINAAIDQIPYNNSISPEKHEENFYKNKNIYNDDAYLIKLDGSEIKYLGSYMHDSLVSPDLKYVMYTKPHYQGTNEAFTETNMYDSMLEGFYIKNIETNQTTYIPYDEWHDNGDIKDYKVVGWVKKDCIDKFLNE